MTAVKAGMSPSRHWRRSIIKNTFSKFYTIGGIMKCNKQMERCLTVRFPTAQSLIRVALVSIEKHDQTHNRLCVFGTAIVKLCFKVQRGADGNVSNNKQKSPTGWHPRFLLRICAPVVMGQICDQVVLIIVSTTAAFVSVWQICTCWLSRGHLRRYTQANLLS